MDPKAITMAGAAATLLIAGAGPSPGRRPPVHTFRDEPLPADERRRRAAEWIEAGLADLRRAAEQLGGDAPERAGLWQVIGQAGQFAATLRHRGSVPPPESPPPAG